MSKLVLVLGILAGSSAQALSPLPRLIEAKILDRKTSELLFQYERREVYSNGPQSEVVRTFRSPEGGLAVEERVQYLKDRSQKFELKHQQIGADGFYEVRGDKVFFSYTENGKTRTAEERYTDEFIGTDEVILRIRQNWDALLGGKELRFRLAVLPRRETIGFKVYRVDDTLRDGQKLVTLKMKPTSFLIAALVNPLYFYAEPFGEYRILEVDGRVTPMRKVGSKFKDLDALLRVTW